MSNENDQNSLGKKLAKSSSLLPGNVSLRSIIFWRHLVIIAVILALAPPYFGGNLAEFAGGVLGKLLLTLTLAGVCSSLGLLFFTKAVKGRYWWLFVECAWFFGAIVIFLGNYGMKS